MRSGVSSQHHCSPSLGPSSDFVSEHHIPAAPARGWVASRAYACRRGFFEVEQLVGADFTPPCTRPEDEHGTYRSNKRSYVCLERARVRCAPY